MAQQNGKSKHLSIESGVLTHPTKCLHCSQTFPQALPIVGAPKDTEFLQTCGMIAEHLMRKHPDITQAILQRQAAFGFAVSGIITLGNVETFDEGLSKWRDLSRHALHQFSIRNWISDAIIEARVRELFPDDPHAGSMSEVVALIKEMRDVLEERIGYPIDAQSIVLTGPKR